MSDGFLDMISKTKTKSKQKNEIATGKPKYPPVEVWIHISHLEK